MARSWFWHMLQPKFLQRNNNLVALILTKASNMKILDSFQKKPKPLTKFALDAFNHMIVEYLTDENISIIL